LRVSENLKKRGITHLFVDSDANYSSEGETCIMSGVFYHEYDPDSAEIEDMKAEYLRILAIKNRYGYNSVEPTLGTVKSESTHHNFRVLRCLIDGVKENHIKNTGHPFAVASLIR